jgi:hypothetical protein
LPDSTSKLFQVKSYGIDAPLKHSKPLNPIAQQYVFYPPPGASDCCTVAADVLELTVEPRLGLKIPDLFIQNLIASLERSILAWKKRYHLERMRQGR